MPKYNTPQDTELGFILQEISGRIDILERSIRAQRYLRLPSQAQVTAVDAATTVSDLKVVILAWLADNGMTP